MLQRCLAMSCIADLQTVEEMFLGELQVLRSYSQRCRGRGGGRGEGRGGPGRGDKGDIAGNIYKIIKMIKEKNLEPVIVFSFSRR